MASGDRVYIADKETLDKIYDKVNELDSKVIELDSNLKEIDTTVVNLSNSGTGILKGVDTYTGPLKIPYNFSQGCAVTYKNEIHLLGGNNSRRSHYKFDGVNWVSVSELPYDFYQGSAVVYNNEIHIMGGFSNNNNHYKFDGTQWVLVAKLPNAVFRAGCVVHNNEIHLLGGYSSAGTATKNYYKFNGTSWSTATPTLPYETGGCSAVVYNGSINLMGGTGSATGRFVLEDGSWTVLQLPISITYNSCLVWNNEIHILGGSTTSDYKSHHKFNGTDWEKLTSFDYEFYEGSATVFDDKIYMLGGSHTASIRTMKMYESLLWVDVNKLANTKYYLLKGTRILCDNTKTKVDGDVTSIDEGYLVNNTGIITINFTTDDSRCYVIV